MAVHSSSVVERGNSSSVTSSLALTRIVIIINIIPTITIALALRFILIRHPTLTLTLIHGTALTIALL